MSWNEIINDAIQARHWFHRHPELTWQEENTAVRIRERLTELGIQWRAYAEYGTVAALAGGAARSAVAAVKIGATDYLSKPADATDITNALLANGADLPPPPENPMSAARVRWEHIQRVYELCDRNVSETARRLNMHRRTLQRILAKRAPR